MNFVKGHARWVWPLHFVRAIFVKIDNNIGESIGLSPI
jgi:hypothetical protein